MIMGGLSIMSARSADMCMILTSMTAPHLRTCLMTGNVRDASKARISTIRLDMAASIKPEK